MDAFPDSQEIALRYGRYAEDVRRLYIFHGLSCGSARDFGEMAAKLEESTAFRADLAALARSIGDLEQGQMTAEEMLAVLAVASGGERLLTDEGGSVPVSRTTAMLRMLLAGVGGWRRAGERIAGKAWEAGATAGTARSGPGGVEQVGANGDGRGGAGADSAAEVREERARLEMTLRGLQEHLRGLDERVDRLEPRVDGITQLLHAPAEQLPKPQNGFLDGLSDSAAKRELPITEAMGLGGGEVLVAEPGRRGGGVFGRGMEIAAAEGSIAEAHASGEEPGVERRQAEGVREAEPETRTVTDGSRGIEWLPERNNGTRAIPSGERLLSGKVDRPGEEQPEALPSRASFVAEGRGDAASEAVTAGRPERSTREKAGRLLAVAAALLAVLGVFGMRSMMRQSEDAGVGKVKTDRRTEAAGEGRVQPAPAPQTVPVGEAPAIQAPALAARDANGVGAAPSGVGASAAPGLPGAGAANKGGEAVPQGRVAGKRLEVPAPQPRIEESPRSARAGGAVGGSTATRPERKGTRDEIESGTAGSSPKGPLLVPQETMEKRLLSARKPVYPPDALRDGVEGKVVVNAFISKEGTVRRMDVVEGSPVFVHSALAAVSWRRYRPYLVEGRPVEVKTQITVRYPGQ